MRLADHHTVPHTDDALRLAEHHFDLPRVLVPRLGELLRERARRHRRQVDDPTLGLRYHLLRNDEHVARLDAAGGTRRIDDDRREVVASVDLGHAGDGNDADFGHAVTVTGDCAG